MTLRPLRPLQIARRVDNDGENADVTEPPRSRIKLGPVIAPTALPAAKRATCSQCRVRKVRCDGRDDVCQNCERLGFECSFRRFPNGFAGRYALKPPEPRRRTQACSHCHLKKTRCYGELPRCSSCVRKGWECVYPNSRKQGAAAAATASAATSGPDDECSSTTSGREMSLQHTPNMVEGRNPSPSTTEKVPGPFLEDIATVVGHMEDYFDHLYPLPSFAFLHKSTVIRRCRDGTINEPLKLAICAVTSLHLQRASLCHHLWAQQAEQLVLQGISRPSIFHLQALVLVVRYRIENGEFPTAFMLAALAARTAVALRLNYERSELAPVAQEARRRLYWALYLLDDYFCVGLREFELCPEETIHLQLPCREEIFGAGQHCQTAMLQPGASDNVTVMGLRGAFIRLTSARRAVMRFNRRVGLGEESSSTIGARIRQFEQELECLRAAFSPEHQYSVSNLASCAWPAQFVMLHISYYQCHCDLYRMFLNGYSEAAPSGLLASICAHDRLTMQARCLEHAENIIQILDDFITLHPGRGGDGQPNPPLLLERDAAVCAFESARLVMFGARLPCATSTPELSIRKARRISLRLITEFFPFSASTRSLRTALEHLTSSYSNRLVEQSSPLPQPRVHPQPQLQQQQQQQQESADTRTREALSEPEPAAPRPASSKISQYANSRQRLSVQSLLLQSDFADDSHEIAGPPVAPPVSLPPSLTPPPPPSATSRDDAVGRWQQEGDAASYPGFRRATMTMMTTAAAAGAPALPPGTGYADGGSSDSSGSSSHMNRAYSHSQPLMSRPPSDSPSSPWGLTIDARREDAGLIFNPWMGFTGTEGFYGILEGLGEEY